MVMMRNADASGRDGIMTFSNVDPTEMFPRRRSNTRELSHQGNYLPIT